MIFEEMGRGGGLYDFILGMSEAPDRRERTQAWECKILVASEVLFLSI